MKSVVGNLDYTFPALSAPLKWSMSDSWRRPFTTPALTCGKICVLYAEM